MRRVSLKVFCIGLRWRVCLFYLPIIHFRTFLKAGSLQHVQLGTMANSEVRWHLKYKLRLKLGHLLSSNTHKVWTLYWHAKDSNDNVNNQTRAKCIMLSVVTHILTPLLLCWLLSQTMCCCDCCGECYHICCWAKLGWVALLGRTKRDLDQGYKDNDYPHPTTPSTEANIIIFIISTSALLVIN